MIGSHVDNRYIEDALLKSAVLNLGHLGLFLKSHISENQKVQFLINSDKVQFPIWYVSTWPHF